jgi:exopolyphosphatase/pppGpp-phosphohydrolase
MSALSIRCWSRRRQKARLKDGFAGHGALIDQWIAPLFSEDAPAFERIRRAACYLGDVGWRANPDFRAERGMEVALHGNWVGIDGWGRAMLAQALYSNFGGGNALAPSLETLASRARSAARLPMGTGERIGRARRGAAFDQVERIAAELSKRQPSSIGRPSRTPAASISSSSLRASRRAATSISRRGS